MAAQRLIMCLFHASVGSRSLSWLFFVVPLRFSFFAGFFVDVSQGLLFSALFDRKMATPPEPAGCRSLGYGTSGHF